MKFREAERELGNSLSSKQAKIKKKQLTKQRVRYEHKQQKVEINEQDDWMREHEAHVLEMSRMAAKKMPSGDEVYPHASFWDNEYVHKCFNKTKTSFFMFQIGFIRHSNWLIQFFPFNFLSHTHKMKNIKK